jgi:hypothetical protein
MGDVEGLRVEGARTKEWWAWGEKMRTRRNGGRWSDSAQGRHTSSNEELREGERARVRVRVRVRQIGGDKVLGEAWTCM